MTPLAVSWNLCHLIFFTIYLSSNLGSGLGTRLSFKVLILTEKNFYIPFFLFSHQAGQCTAKPGSNAVKVSNGGHLWKIQRLKCFKGRRIQFVTRRFAYLDGMSLRKRLIIWSDHIWFTKADFSVYSLVCLGGNHLVNSSRCQGSLYRRPVSNALGLESWYSFTVPAFKSNHVSNILYLLFDRYVVVYIMDNSNDVSFNQEDDYSPFLPSFSTSTIGR